jgi:hypothetical protein
MPLQFLEHPLPVDTLLLGVMQNVNLPKAQQKLAHYWIIHGVTLHALSRWFGFQQLDAGART